ncbi:MAG: hypothetical protein JWQ49_4407 [Edaphobacter sp.]|nr:hypothetical protein [Edaphobacter sp.]
MMVPRLLCGPGPWNGIGPYGLLQFGVLLIREVDVVASLSGPRCWWLIQLFS